MGLLHNVSGQHPEAGVDEAGRGALAGPVVAAAVILPKGYICPEINDSKQLSAAARNRLRSQIMADAVAWNVGICSNQTIDQINILRAAHQAMCEAVAGLGVQPLHLAIDGNRFVPHAIRFSCMVKGDARFLHIAAASILAKTFRDDIMLQLHQAHPHYGWAGNKGYPTAAHRAAIAAHGVTPWHRRSFQLLPVPSLF
jgi:ribonuclease HII